MKLFLLSTLFLFTVLFTKGQEVKALPSGKYETVIKNNGKWEKGDIVLLDKDHYKITSTSEKGEYRFSATAQRVFFTSGPLKGIFARTVMAKGSPTIFIPLNENQQLGLKVVTADIVGALRN